MRTMAATASARIARALWARAFDERGRRAGRYGPRTRTADLEWLRRENARLARAVGQLALLNERAKDIGSTLDSTRILRTITRRARRVVRAEQSAICLIETGEPGTRTRVRVASNPEHGLRVYLQDGVVGWMGLHRETLLVDDCQRDSQFRSEAKASTIRSLLVAPLLLPPDASNAVATARGTHGLEQAGREVLHARRQAAVRYPCVPDGPSHRARPALRRRERDRRMEQGTGGGHGDSAAARPCRAAGRSGI